MIFVTLGNVPLPFARLAEAADKLAGETQEEMVMQTGFTVGTYPHAKVRPFLGAEEMADLLTRADIVVAHGGWGTISECLRLGKKVVAVPRIQGIEHNHPQEELVRALDNGGHLIGVYEIEKLPEAVARARTFVGNRLIRGRVPSLIKAFMETVV